LLAQKASEELDIKPKIEQRDCSCEQCRHPIYSSRDASGCESVETCVEEVLMKCLTPDLKLATGPRELVSLLASEMKRLTVKNEDKMREISMTNQRLQTEMHLMKSEYSKKLTDAIDTKAHLEQELEVVQRERQKDIAHYNRLTWEFTQELEKKQLSSDDRAFDRMSSEIRSLRHKLDQTSVDRDNLRKQLSWHVNRDRHTSSKMEVDKWTPFPTIGKKFSDSEGEEEERKRRHDMESKLNSNPSSPIFDRTSNSRPNETRRPHQDLNSSKDGTEQSIEDPNLHPKVIQTIDKASKSHESTPSYSGKRKLSSSNTADTDIDKSTSHQVAESDEDDEIDVDK
jgi:Skp family chaperone for outer membrane proteins